MAKKVYTPLFLFLITCFLIYFMLIKPMNYRKVFNFGSDYSKIIYNGVQISDDRYVPRAIELLNNIEGRELSFSGKVEFKDFKSEMICPVNDTYSVFIKVEEGFVKSYRIKNTDLKSEDITSDVNVYYVKDTSEIRNFMEELKKITEDFKKNKP